MQYIELLNSVPQAIMSALIKIVIWMIPVILFVKFVEKRKPFIYLGLRQHFNKGLQWAGWSSVILISFYFLLNFVVLDHPFNLQLSFNTWLNTIILVGFTEEIVFRGFLLKKLNETYHFWLANIITSLLFVSIHFPIWFYKGLFVFPNILSPILTVFLISIIFGVIYQKSNSLWSVIILHSLYNLLVSLFY